MTDETLPLIADGEPIAGSAAKRTKPKIERGVDFFLRRAMEDSELKCEAIARLAGVSPRPLQRFLSGERDLLLGTAARVCAALGLKLIDTGRRPR